MTEPEIASIRTHIQQIANLKVAEAIAKQFPTIDLNQHRFSNLTASQFIAFTERLVTQFTELLDSPDAPLLSKGYYWETHHQGMGHRHIFSVIQQLTNHVTSRQWDGASQWLEVAIGYVIQNGYWDRSARKLQSVSKLRQSALFGDLEAKGNQFREILSVINNLQSQQQQETSKRQSDAAAVATQLTQIQKHGSDIAALLAKSAGQDGQIAQILSSQEANLEKTKAELKAIGDGKARLAESLDVAAEKLESSEERLKFMESKTEWVNELAGTAAAGVLGQKFEARTRELAAASNWWLVGTVGAVVVGAAWIAFAHKYLLQSSADIWLTFALNFGLLLPALFLVGFFAKQFGKVRQFEEEYAFRSSIAMTLSAFADRLGGSESERNKLITDTVERLYRLPILLQEHEPAGWFSQRSTERMVKATTELVAAVKKPTS